MPIELTHEGMRQIFPRAPQEVINAFVERQAVLDAVGVTHTRTRLSYFFANIEHECGGFTIRNLTENISYTAERMAQVWPNRFRSAADVRAKYGTASGWQRAAFDDIYGNRMGNRPGTHDGSTYIGRGGPQWTGRDGYAEVEKRTGLPALSNPSVVSSYIYQPDICAAFWAWKRLNTKADVGDFRGCVKLWNGGTNGMADRLSRMAGNDPIIARLAVVNHDKLPKVKELPGSPPTPEPPKDLVDRHTQGARNARNGGAAGTVIGVGDQTTTKVLPQYAPYAIMGVGVVVAIVAIFLIIRKKRALSEHWF